MTLNTHFVVKLGEAQGRVEKRIRELDAQANSGHPDSLDAIKQQVFLEGMQEGLDQAMMLYKISTGWEMD